VIEHLSVSQIDMFQRCAEQYRRVYLEGDRKPPGIAALVGSGVHKAAEHNFKQKLRTKVDEPLDVLTDIASETYKKRAREGVFIPRDEESSAPRLLEEGQNSTVALTKLFREQHAPKVMPFLIEERVYLDVDGLPVPFLGIVDLYTHDKRLSDLKTSARKWSEGRAHSSLQATMYCELVKHLTGEPPARITFDILVNSKTPTLQTLETSRTDEDFRLLVSRAQIVLASIQAGIFPPADPNAWCCSPKFCGFWWTCPYIPRHKKDTTGV